MKPILIATDFTASCRNAADYAAQLAKTTGAELIIFHAWTIPVMSGEIVTVPFPYPEFQDAEKKAITNEANRIEKIWNIKVKALQTAGYAVEEIENCVNECKPELVVMGMRHTDPIEWVFGSVVTAFIKRDFVPLLVIPEKSKFILPEKILLATDLNSKIGFHVLDILKKLAASFTAEIHILNVIAEKLQPIDSIAERSGQQLQELLKRYPHTWHYEETTDVINGIFKVADEIPVQWISVIHHHISWVKRLFHKSTARQLTFLTNIPLLVLPEQTNELKSKKS